MPSAYLTQDDLASYGLPATLPESLIIRASALIDTFCHRPLVITQHVERLRVPAGRNRVILAYLPMVALSPATTPYVSAKGRYGYPRRGAVHEQVFPAATLYQLTSVFGGPPAWEDIDITQLVDDPRTGELWLPAGIYMAHYTDVEITYTAGYATTPDPVKAACAEMIHAYLARAAVAGSKGGVAVAPMDASLITPDVKAILEPYRARALR